MVVDMVLERLLVSTSYSAVTQISTLFQKSSIVVPNTIDIWSITIFFLLVLCVIITYFSRGLRNTSSMMAAQMLTNMLPIPQEQSGFLVVPGITLYFSIIASLVWIMHLYKSIFILFINKNKNDTKNKDNNSTEFLESIEQYMVLFAASRGLARFKAMNQIHLLGIISIIYIFWPSFDYTKKAAPIDTEKSIKKKEEDKNEKRLLEENKWHVFFIRIVECLAIRGFLLWVSTEIQKTTGSSGTLGIVFWYWVLLFWNPFIATSKFQACGDVLALMSVQQLMIYMQNKLKYNLSILSVFLCFLISFINMNICPHSACTVCMIGASMSLTSWLERWIQEINSKTEQFVLYLLIFQSVECLITSVKEEKEKQDKNKDGILLVESSSIKNDGIHDNNSKAGITHEQTTLGLPQLSDAQGNQ